MLPDYTHSFFKETWDFAVSTQSNRSIKLIKLTLMEYTPDESLADIPVSGFMYEDSSALDIYRSEELLIYSSLMTGYVLTGFFDNRKATVYNAILSIARTIMVCLVLGISTFYLSKDAESLVIQPIEAMMSKIKRISENPLEAAALEEKEMLHWEEIKEKDETARALFEEQSNYEPSVLEKVIMKIGALLAIGFGEAGSEIIATNMAGSKFYFYIFSGNNRSYAQREEGVRDLWVLRHQELQRHYRHTEKRSHAVRQRHCEDSS